ncbi:MAG: HAMP domain-containing histidine kinase [Chloroflexi bacterium]|nr:HAMP domain-containing histidine kinase [Chloroflexota bacterium]
MPDGTELGSVDAAEAAAVAADGRLVTGVGRRLVLWAAGTTLLVLIGLGIALYVAVSSSLSSTGVRQLDARAADLRRLIEGPSGRPPDGDDLPTGGLFGGPTSGTFVLILDQSGHLIVPRSVSTSSGLPDTASFTAAKGGGRDVRLATINAGTANATPVRVLTTPVQSMQVGTVYLQVFQDRTAEERTLNVLLGVLLVGGLIILVVAAGVGTIYSRRALVPIRESLTAQRRALRRQREFAADASHELRTPLTVVRASVEYLRRHAEEPVAQVGDALDDIDAEVDHLTRLVEELLLLARSDSGAVSLERTPVDLGEVAADAASSLSQTASERGITIAAQPEPAPLLGDAARLRQLVVILVDNAIAHSPRGGTVSVTVRRAAGHAQLVVEDEGDGLREDDLPRIFERFWRGAGAPPGGAGLGLAIAHWIVTAHGGTITAENREPRGARFVVDLPAGG